MSLYEGTIRHIWVLDHKNRVFLEVWKYIAETFSTTILTLLVLYDCFLTNYKVKSGERQKRKRTQLDMMLLLAAKINSWHLKGAKEERHQFSFWDAQPCSLDLEGRQNFHLVM